MSSIFFCVCMYKMNTFSIKTWTKNDVEAIKHNDKKKWMNEKALEKNLGYKNLAGDKT